MAGRRGIILTALTLAGTLLAAGAPAAAQAATGRATHGRTTEGARVRPAGPGLGPAMVRDVRNASSTSSDWAGYVAQSGTYTSVSGSWTAPAVTCTSGDQDAAFWVGFDGWESNTVEQTGTTANCRGTTAQYFAWYEIYPSPVVRFHTVVNPGDVMSGSVTYDGSNNYTFVLKDTTRHWSRTVTMAETGASRNSAEAIAEAPCCTKAGNPQPLSEFSPVSFSNVTANGSAIGTFGPLQLTMINNHFKDKAVTSALTGNNSFTVTWKRRN